MSLLLKKFYDIFEYNSSTLSGCLDVIVVQKKDGSLHSSPFHVRIGKFKAFNTKLKKIQVFVNNADTKTHLVLNKEGIGYFEEEVFYSLQTTDGELETSSACFQSDEDSPEVQPKPINEVGNIEKTQNSKIEKISNRKYTDCDSSNEASIKTSVKLQRKLSDYKIKDDSSMLNKSHFLKNESKNLEENNNDMKDVQISLCGHLINEEMSPDEINSRFDDNLVSFTKFDSHPSEILDNEQLMIRIGTKIYDRYFGLPQLFAKLVFKQELSQYSITNLKNNLLNVGKIKASNNPKTETQKKLKRSLKPTSEFWKNVNLKVGINELQYRFKGNLDTDQSLRARIFYYPYEPNFKVIISDIDGTITKSDILGHLMPFIYKDWSQNGIAEFYTNLSKNGYKIVYLTARNIGQAHKTLIYLKSVNQKGVLLPEGPLITSPDTFYESVRREIIIKNPEVFKIRVLKQLKQLFNGNSDSNPLYCGFGNKDSDAIAYAVVGVSKKRIFTINPDGDIFLLKSGHVTNYVELNQNIPKIFPKIEGIEIIEERSEATSKDDVSDRVNEEGN